MFKTYLRLLKISDASKSYVRWLNDESVNKYTEQRFSKTRLSDVVNFIKKGTKSKKNYTYGIFIEGINKHIGNITLGSISLNHKTAEVGFFLGEKKFWDKGIASISIKKIIRLAKKKFKLKKLLAGCYEINKNSIHLLTKNNFILEATLKSQVIYKKKRYNYLIYGYLIK